MQHETSLRGRANCKCRSPLGHPAGARQTFEYFADPPITLVSALLLLLSTNIAVGVVTWWQVMHGSLPFWLIFLYYLAWDVNLKGRL